MRRLLLTILSVLTVLLVAAIAYGAWRNPEKTTLDATARAKSPGKFIALSRGTTHYEMAGPNPRITWIIRGNTPAAPTDGGTDHATAYPHRP